MRAPALLTVFGLVTLSANKPAAAQEICGNLIDDDNDNPPEVDEGCWSAAITGVCESPLACGRTGAVAPSTGQLVYQEPADIAPRVPYGPPLTLSRTYMSQGADQTGYRGSLGKGWRHSFQSWLALDTTPNPDEVVIRLVSGQEVLFTYSSQDATYDYFTPQVGYHVNVLRRNRSTSLWEMITLEGWTYEYTTSDCGGVRLLDRILDPFGQAVDLTYDGSCYLSEVTDASSYRDLRFSYDANNKLDKVDYYIDNTLELTVQYTVTSDKLDDVTVGSSKIRTYTWTGNKLDAIKDGEATPRTIADVDYLANGTAGKVARIATPDGRIGYRYGDSNCDGGAGVYVFYNVQDSSPSCDTDADCASGNLCGGETDAGNGETGLCYRARRCVAMSSTHADLVDAVSSPECSTCTDTKTYIWNTGLDLLSRESADQVWTHYDRNADGLVTRIVEGDDDSTSSTVPAGARVTWMFYHSAVRGLVTEVRRLTEVTPSQGGNCDGGSTVTDCKRTLYSYGTTAGNGRSLDSVTEEGWTYTWNGVTAPQRTHFSYETNYAYDTVGRLTQIDGPRSSTDITEFSYWTSTDRAKHGMLQDVTRYLTSTTTLVMSYNDYDYWGNAGSIEDENGNFTCRTFHADLDVMTQSRVSMNNQTSCASPHSSDLVTSMTYNSQKKLLRLTKPLGNCTRRTYDSPWGRLSTLTDRDDCIDASTGDSINHTYNDDGLTTKIEHKDGSGNTTYRHETTYGDDRRLLEILNPTQTSKKKTFAYHADGMIASITGEDGVGITEWEYDSRNRAEAELRHLDSSTSDDWGLTNCRQMDRVVDVSDEDGKSIERSWDDLQRSYAQVTVDGGNTWLFHDEAGNVTTRVEGAGTADEIVHTFTYDAQGRIFSADYDPTCTGPTISYVYDSPGGCPTGTCVNSEGRLAFVKTMIACDPGQGDGRFDQFTYFGYDDAGRIVKEVIQDDGGRNVTQNYTWDKNGNLLAVEAPSSVDLKWTYGSGSSNSDSDKVTSLVRNDGTDTTVTSNGTWYPFGPIKQYEQANTISSNNIIARFTWDLAHRPVEILHEQESSGTDLLKIAYTLDAQGRIVIKDFTGGHAELEDSYYTYDWQDRIVCDANASGTCPTQGSGNLKSNLSSSPPYTASSDRRSIIHRANQYVTDTYTYDYLHGTLNELRDQIDSIARGSYTIDLGWDGRGNRLYDDDSEYADDRRDYTYDGRNNLITVSGKMKVDTAIVHDYTMVNAFDHKNRRIFKSLLDEVTSLEEQWFYYYDPMDRVVEVKYTPNITDTDDYQVFQFHWIGQRPVAWFRMTYVNGSLQSNLLRRFAHTDHLDTPVEAYFWPASGDATRSWALQSDAFGWAAVLQGTTYQPFRFPGQLADEETAAYFWLASESHFKKARPPLSENRYRVYDPLTASYLQSDPMVDSSWNSYAYAENSPVMTTDESGLLSCFLGGCDSGPSDDEIKRCQELFEYLAWLLQNHYFYLKNPTPHGQDLAWKYYSTYLEIKRMYEGVFGCVAITGPAPAIYQNWQVPFLGGEPIPDQAGVLESTSDPLRDVTTEPMPRQGPVLAPVRQSPRGELPDDLGFSIRPTRRQ